MSQTTGSQATSKLTSIPAQTKPFDKDKRRDTNKKLVELETLQFQLKKASESLKDAEKKQQLEQSRHQDLVGRVEEANNVLSVAQEEIDCDPYPEGAQPIARIKKRDELALVGFAKDYRTRIMNSCTSHGFYVYLIFFIYFLLVCQPIGGSISCTTKGYK